MTPARRRPIHDFLDVARAVGVRGAYPAEQLRDGKRRGDVYCRTDTHWNQRGAYVAYLALCEALTQAGRSVPVVREATIRWRSSPASGDLGSKLRPQTKSDYVRAELERHTSRLVFDNRVRNHGRVLIFESDVEGGSCVVFGESFANHLLIFLKESFRRLVFVHTSMMIGEILTRERPDVALSLPLERFLVQVPSDHDSWRRLTTTVRSKLTAGMIVHARRPYLIGVPQTDAAKRDQIGEVPW